MSKPMKKSDPAYWMLHDSVESTPVVHNPTCYICRDPEFAQMGLPLCFKCIVCQAHVPADDLVCDNGHVQPTDPFEELMIRREYQLEITPEVFHRAVAADSWLGIVKVYLGFYDASWMKVDDNDK